MSRVIMKSKRFGCGGCLFPFATDVIIVAACIHVHITGNVLFLIRLITIILITVDVQVNLGRGMRFPTMWYVRPTKAQTSLRIRAD